MKCLIVKDDSVSIKSLTKMISRYSSFDVVANGSKAINNFRNAHDSNSPYDLIIIDIMLPDIVGLQTVLTIRAIEALMNIPFTRSVNVVITTSFNDSSSVMMSLCESDANFYIIKPNKLLKLEYELRKLRLISRKYVWN